MTGQIMQILIIEGDTPEQLAISARQGQLGNSDYYRDAINLCRSDLNIHHYHPYASDFNLAMLDLEHIDGVIFTGSTVNWSVDAPEAKPLRLTMEKVFKYGKPTLGSCNGMQLGAVVLGGAVAASPNGLELGVAKDIQLTEAGKTHPLHAGRSERYACPCIHRDEVSQLPTGATLTATNTHSPVQGMIYEHGDICFWGVQYHPEIAASQIAQIVSGDGLFNSSDNLATQLRDAENDPFSAAAVTLGIRGSDLQPSDRTLELANWLTMIETKRN